MSRKPKKKEAVNHPEHYGGKGNPYEVVKIIEANGWLEGFCLGNTTKYIMRAGKKSPDKIQDLEKGLWYLNYFIESLNEKSTKI
jgi:hypothetical protein